MLAGQAAAGPIFRRRRALLLYSRHAGVIHPRQPQAARGRCERSEPLSTTTQTLKEAMVAAAVRHRAGRGLLRGPQQNMGPQGELSRQGQLRPRVGARAARLRTSVALARSRPLRSPWRREGTVTIQLPSRFQASVWRPPWDESPATPVEVPAMHVPCCLQQLCSSLQYYKDCTTSHPNRICMQSEREVHYGVGGRAVVS